MKWFKPHEWQNTVSDPFVSDTHYLGKLDKWDFRGGVQISDWNNRAFLKACKVEYDGDPDDVLQNHLGIQVYSARLRDALENAKIGGIQYLPVHVYRPNDEEIIGFSIVNILNSVPALDMQRSKYTRFPMDFPNPIVRGEIEWIAKVVLESKSLRGYDIIRLKEYEVQYYVSERFKDIFENSGFTGYSFSEVELA